VNLDSTKHLNAQQNRPIEPVPGNFHHIIIPNSQKPKQKRTTKYWNRHFCR